MFAFFSLFHFYLLVSQLCLPSSTFIYMFEMFHSYTLIVMNLIFQGRVSFLYRQGLLREQLTILCHIVESRDFSFDEIKVLVKAKQQCPKITMVTN